MTAPLLNEDKISFISRRIISTLSGWRRADTATLNVIQFVLFFVPWISAGIVGIFWSVQNRWNVNLAWIGVSFTILCLVVKFLRQEISTWRTGICVVLSSLVYGVFQVLAVNNLFFGSFESGNLGLQIAIYILCWISVCIAQFVLLIGHIPEPNTYYTEQNEWDNVTRAAYLIIPVTLSGLIASDYVYSTFYIIAFFPLITLAGFLPRIDIFLEYSFEFICQVFLGIGPHKNLVRSITDGIISVIILVLCYVFARNQVQILLCLGLLSTLLSSSIFWDLLFLHKIVASKSAIFSLCARLLICGIFIWCGDYFASFISLICLTLVSIILLTSEIQQEIIPSVFPVFHNPLKAKIRNSKSSFTGNVAFVLGSSHLLCRLLAPIFITVWITSSSVAPHYVGNNWANGLCFYRALRCTWQDVNGMTIDIYIMCIFNAIDVLSNSYYLGTITPPGYQKIDIQLLFLIFCFRQVFFRFMGKLWFWILSFYHFTTSRKHVLKRWYLYLIPAIIISPISITLSAFFNAPVMPLLGLPIFWMGFCRPKRMWPNIGEFRSTYSIERTCSIGDEAEIYSALCPSLLASISNSISKGRIPPLYQGSVLIARFESRILMIRCLETSFEDMKVMVMGAELEPTSCHSVEGTELDSVLDNSLSSAPRRLLNHHFFSTIVPLDIVLADAYSESKMVMTGILDSKDSLNLIPIIYFKVLVHHLLAGLDTKSLDAYQNPPIDSALLVNSWKKFPVRWYEYVQLHSKNVLEKNLEQDFMILVTLCYVITLGICSSSDLEVRITPNSIFDMYRGDLPHSTQISVRNWFLDPSRIKLRELCLRSVRSTVKLTIDQAIEGEPESLGALLDILEGYSQEWLITIDPAQIGPNDVWAGPQSWRNALNSGIPNLFSLSRNKDKVISVRLLTRKLCPVKIARINSEAVMGIWANLVLEMLYITNDDDERYSIQAHEMLLRNITIQLAAQPFGYPIWTSHCTLRRDGLISSDQSKAKRISPIS